jgi:hypothetical protein
MTAFVEYHTIYTHILPYPTWPETRKQRKQSVRGGWTHNAATGKGKAFHFPTILYQRATAARALDEVYVLHHIIIILYNRIGMSIVWLG